MSSTQLCGMLERNGKNWQLPLEFLDWDVCPSDDLHPGDHLHFPELAELCVLRLQVVTRYGRMDKDEYFKSCDRCDYCLSAYARCRGCGYRAVQDVIIIAGDELSFARVCVWCGQEWGQGAVRRRSRWRLG